LILCIKSHVDVTVRVWDDTMESAERQCAEGLGKLICMCEIETKPRFRTDHDCVSDHAWILPKARVVESLADFLCNCHNNDLASDVHRDCMDAVQHMHRYRKRRRWWHTRSLALWKTYGWRRCLSGCNMLVRVALDKDYGYLGLIRCHDLGPDSTFNGGPAQDISSLYRVTSTGSCEYRGWHNEHDRFCGGNWKDLVIPVLSKLGRISWVDQVSQR